MRLVFAGTPDFATAPLQALLDAAPDIGAQIVGVLTQPDRPAGRGRQTQPSPVRQVAQRHGLPVATPTSLKGVDALAPLADWQPDLLVVIAYGLLLPQPVLDWPRQGCVNVHASLLPRWRGAAPIQRAIEAGDSETGLCLMQMELGLDTGPVLATERLALEPLMTASLLHDALVARCCARLPGWLQALHAGALHPQPQPEQGVTYAHKLHKAEAQLDLGEPAAALARKVRAFDSWPAAQIRHAGAPLRLLGAAQAETVAAATVAAEAGASGAAPGTILALDAAGVLLATGEGGLRVPELQFAGRRRLPAAEALRGPGLGPGDRLGA